MMFYGKKKKDLFDDFISKFIPKHISVYVEPFGGTFSVNTYLNNKPKLSVYNDINVYDDINISADIIYHKDYKFIFDKYDSSETVFYIDPPYYKKEYLYNKCSGYSDNFHIDLCNNIKGLLGKVILSYEDKYIIRELYKNFNIFNYKGNNQIFNNEIIITNFNI